VHNVSKKLAKSEVLQWGVALGMARGWKNECFELATIGQLLRMSKGHRRRFSPRFQWGQCERMWRTAWIW